MRSLLTLALLAAMGCDSADAPAPFEARSPSSARERDEQTTTAEATPEPPSMPTEPPAPAPRARSWAGTIPATRTVDFGGDGFCRYRVVLTNVRVQVTFDAEGKILASNIDNTMTETLAEACDAKPLGKQTNRYLVQASQAPIDALFVSFEPQPENLPQAQVMLTLEPVDDRTMKGHVTVQRIGGSTPALDWNVDADVELAPQ
ncbi:MAG: hypothetical protein U0270_06205 [Labilithrix sp.]